MSLMLLSSLQALVFYQQGMNKQEMQHQRFYQLEHTAQQLIALMPTLEKRCLRHQDNANQIMHLLDQAQGCSFRVGATTFYYLVEDLGHYSCVVVLDDKVLKPTHHFRMSVVAQSDKEQHLASSFLQMRIIKPSSAPLDCLGGIQYRALGISSWRYLTL